jgi:hypothetical protein
LLLPSASSPSPGAAVSSFCCCAFSWPGLTILVRSGAEAQAARRWRWRGVPHQLSSSSISSRTLLRTCSPSSSSSCRKHPGRPLLPGPDPSLLTWGQVSRRLPHRRCLPRHWWWVVSPGSHRPHRHDLHAGAGHGASRQPQAAPRLMHGQPDAPFTAHRSCLTACRDAGATRTHTNLSGTWLDRGRERPLSADACHFGASPTPRIEGDHDMRHLGGLCPRAEDAPCCPC